MNDSLANIINRLLDTIGNLNRQLDGAKMAVVKKNTEIDELERKLNAAEDKNNNCRCNVKENQLKYNEKLQKLFD